MEQDRKCVYNITLRRVRVTVFAVEKLAIFAVEKQYVLHIVRVCNVSYPACNAHAPYCHLWPARFYGIFPRYLTNGTNFEKKKIIEPKMCVYISSTTFV